MARAYPSSPPQDYDQEPAGEWQALRGELVSLLDQVESQVARTRRDDQGYQGISERMRDLRYQVTEAEPEMRHREALRSVKRAVDRLNDREEAYAPPGYAPRQDTPNPRDTLQSAIQQIRSRHMGSSAPAPRAAEPVPPRMELPHFDELAHAVGGISGRLERLESELRGAAKIQTGNVKEIAEQVAQLSHVVELLAGAVGETGQVKRLESQIAGLAKLVAQGPQVDLSALDRRLDDMSATFGKLIERQNKDGLAQRLDDVSATMGRLADLQVQHANRADNSGLKDGMRAIEDGVRHVYDRIDTIERSTALSPDDLERLTDEMARVTEALRNPVHSERLTELVELVENINRRVGSIESSSREVGGLKADMAALSATVAEAVEPRFAALEMQIGALSDRIGEQPEDISVGQLEAQVRQLVARMDQTGEQLTGLARLYATPMEREPAPDFEALADMVAARTSEAMAHTGMPVSSATGGMSDAHIDEIEKRVSRLFTEARAEKPSDDLGGIETSIREVNDRLARLETSLTERAREAERLAALPPEPMPERMAPKAVAPLESFGPSGDPIGTQETTATPRLRSDAMPANPAADAPLRDRPFGDENSAIKSALDAKNGPRKHHPGLSYEPLPDQGGVSETPVLAGDVPAFDPAAVARPPRPTSSFDAPGRDAFTAPEGQAPVVAEAATDSPSTNTFIAAARRAAQRQQQQEKSSGGSGSLIARAFASFQSSKSAEEKPPVPLAAKPEKLKVEKVNVAKPKPEKKRGRMGRLLAGDKQSPTAWKDDDAGAPAREPVVLSPRPAAPPAPARSDLSAPEQIALDQEAPLSEEKPKESFLSRHRRPILLAAAVVAIAFLTLNLINQRLSQPGNAMTESPPADAVGDTSEADIGTPSTLSNEPFATVPAAVSGPRIIPMVDSLATASIDPAASKGFSPVVEVPAMPAASFAPAAQLTSEVPAATPMALDAIETASLPALATDLTPLAADDLASPVQVEMPPESVGPEPLRTAAANGDARAQFEIAAIYTEGRAIPEDLAAAAVWYERAAAQGFAPAQYRLGNLYENGRGVEKDLEQARLWYQRAAEAGNRMAMHNLAALYASGQLGKQEFDSAAEWFEQAAARGMRDSQFNLGMLYARGLGVTQNLEDSYKWFSIAADKGDADAGKARDDIARSLDAETVKRLDGELAIYTPAGIDLAANFAPIGTWSETFDPGETIRAPEVIKSVQQALTALGYDVGTPDGLVGPKTAEAIKAFERATGMSESGAINPRLLAVLGSQPV